VFNLLKPDSHCPACKKPVRAWQNIPVLSYLLLRGRCANCQTRIHWRYPLVELISAVLSLLVAWHFGPTWTCLAALVLTWSLISLTVIDIDHQLLPDNITLPLLWLGLILSLTGYGTGVSAADAIIGAAAGYLSLWSIYWIFKLLTGREGMGYGDFKLLAVLGAWLGWQQLLSIIILSSLAGATVGITLAVVAGRDKNIPLSFGPYLATAGFIALIWGDHIAALYLSTLVN
jgi:leader peptidase (prepilin peptidase) / N-methyltransferase